MMQALQRFFSRYDVRILTSGLLMAVGLLALPVYLLAPFGRDQGIFAWQALALLQGGLPYVASWDVKGPLVPALYALCFALFGRHEWAPRVIDLLLAAWVCRLLWLHLRGLGRGLAFSNMAVIGLFSMCWLSYWLLAQPDVWVAWLGCALLLLLSRPARPWLGVVCGLAVGAMVLIKPVYAVVGLPLLIQLWQVRQVGRFILAGALLPLLFIGVYVAAGALPAWFEAQVVFNLHSHVGQISDRARAPYPFFLWSDPEAVGLYVFTRFMLANLLMLAGCVLALRRQAGVGGWLFLAMGAAVTLQWRFSAYHLLPMWMIAAVLVALVPPERLRARAALALAVLVLCFGQMVTGAMHLGPFARISDTFTKPQTKVEGFYYADTEEVAAYVKQRTAPEETVYVWGFEALVYYLADRLPPTRYGYNYPLIVGDIAPRRAEVMQSLVQTPPRFIIVQQRDDNSLFDVDSRQALAEFPALVELLEGSYTQVFSNASYLVYQRR